MWLLWRKDGTIWSLVTIPPKPGQDLCWCKLVQCQWMKFQPLIAAKNLVPFKKGDIQLSINIWFRQLMCLNHWFWLKHMHQVLYYSFCILLDKKICFSAGLLVRGMLNFSFQGGTHLGILLLLTAFIPPPLIRATHIYQWLDRLLF